MLDIQYRMHPDISSFPSAEFYDYNLLDGTVDPDGNIAKSLLPPKSKHLAINSETGRRPSVVFLNHDMHECTRNRSKANEGEAKIVIGILEDLLLNNPV
jgi:superfamily I DNA and/or RNA helicase